MSVRRAIIYTTADRYFGLATNFAVVAVVSRLLTPSEIGISVTGSAMVGLAMSLREFASAEFLVQRFNPSTADVRAAFTAMMALTLLISGILYLSAPLIANAYKEDGLVLYLRVVSASILAEVVGATATALLRREMAFGQVALVNVATAASSAGATIALASLGFSYMSFAWAWLLSATLGSVFAVWLRGELWILKPIFRNWRDMLSFGSFNGLNVMLYRIYEQLPYLILGRFVSFDATGHFQRTLAVAQLPDKVFLAGALAVVFPAFSSEVRRGKDLKGAYLTALTYITAVQWPALVVLAILADPVVLILYGNQWLEVVPLVRIVAVASLFSFSFGLNYYVLVSMGAIREVVVRSLIVWPVSALLLLAATPFGLHGMAFSLLVAIPFQAYVSLHFVRRHIPMPWPELALSLWKSAVVTIASAVGPSIVTGSNGGFESAPALAILAAILSAMGWAISIWLVRHPIVCEFSQAAEVLAKIGLPRWRRSSTGM